MAFLKTNTSALSWQLHVWFCFCLRLANDMVSSNRAAGLSGAFLTWRVNVPGVLVSCLCVLVTARDLFPCRRVEVFLF